MTFIKSFTPFILCCLVAMAFGGFFQPDEWYTTIKQAPWSPPNITFGIVWPILYVLIATAGWQLWRTQQFDLVKLWGLQLFFNALWSWIFFGQHWLLVGLIDLSMISLLVALLIWKSWHRGMRVTAVILAPYLVWLCLAWSLNAYIVYYN